MSATGLLRRLATWRERRVAQSEVEAVPTSVLEGVEWHRQNKDDEDNAESVPPEGESVLLNCIWVVESYPPSQIENLKAGLKALGWDEGSPIDPSPGEWLIESRRRLWGGGWKRLGLIVPEGATAFFSADLRGELPAGVEYATAKLHQVLPSVTFAVFCFVFGEHGDDGLLENALRREYETVPRRWPGGRWTFLTPNNLKLEAVGAERRALRLRCEQWLAKRLPGFFADLKGEGGFPTCEFISFLRQRPFERAQGQKASNFLWILRMDNDWDAWQSDGLPGLRLGTAFARDNEPFAWILSGCWPEIFPDDDQQKSYGGRTRPGIINRIELAMLGTFPLLALRAFLIELGVQLTVLRDRVGAVRHDDLGKTAKELTEIQSAALAVSRDLLPIVDEVQSFTDDARRFGYDACDFTAIQPRLQTESLLSAIRTDIQQRAVRLRQLETAIRESISASVVSVHTRVQSHLADENFRLQRTMRTLTWVAVALGVLALLLGLPEAIGRWREWLFLAKAVPLNL